VKFQGVLRRVKGWSGSYGRAGVIGGAGTGDRLVRRGQRPGAGVKREAGDRGGLPRAETTAAGGGPTARDGWRERFPLTALAWPRAPASVRR